MHRYDFAVLACGLALAASTPAAAQSRLSELVSVVDAANPDLAAARSEVQTRTARVKPAGTLADPIVSGSFMTGFTSPPFFPGSSTANAVREFSVAQELPYPGKRALRTRIAGADVDVARYSADQLRLQRIADFKALYIDYRLAAQSRIILDRNRERVRQIITLAEARFSVGQGGQQDVVKSQLELSLLTERQTLVDRQADVLRAQLNGLLNREPHAPIDPTLAFDVATVALDADALAARADAGNAALKRDRQAIQRNDFALSLSRKAILPDFGVRLSFQKYAAGMPWMYGVEVMTNLPLFADRKQRQTVAEATAELATSRAAADATRIAAHSAIGNYVAMAAASRRLITLYDDSIVPQARLALDASLAGYETGRVDFLTVITNVTTILDYELAIEQQHAEYLRALVSLEPLVGDTFVN